MLSGIKSSLFLETAVIPLLNIFSEAIPIQLIIVLLKCFSTDFSRALCAPAAALATAPKEGKKLRQDVKDFYQDYKEDPQAKFDDLKDTAVNFYDEKSGQLVEFSTEKYNDIREKFDNGDISAEKAKDFLVAKKDDIKAKIDSGELSKEKVLDFLALTKEKIADKVNDLKGTVTEQAEEVEDDFELELEQEDLVKKADEISAKADKLVSEASNQVVETVEKVSDEIAD